MKGLALKSIGHIILMLSVGRAVALGDSNSQAYTYYRPITVSRSLVANSVQANFPVYLAYSDPGLKTLSNGGHVASPIGSDIAFFGDVALTKLLAFEIVSYDGIKGSLTAVVLYPNLIPTADTIFYMAYGAASRHTSAADPNQVWAKYLGVYHLEDNGADTTVRNSANASSRTGNGVSRKQTKSMSEAGVLGLGLIFKPKEDYVDLGAYKILNGASHATYSAWVKFSRMADYEPIVSKMDDPAGIGSILGLSGRYHSGNSDWFSSVRTTNTVGTFTKGFGIRPDVWYYVCSVFNAGTITLYVDGSQLNVDNTGTTFISVPETVSHLLLGRSSAYYPPNLAGELDEVRISSQVPDSGRIQTEYNNQRNPRTFAKLGREATPLAIGPTAKSLPVGLLGVTATQAILHYTAPDSNGCSVAVSDNPSRDEFSGKLLNLIHDVDPALFPHADQDTRAGNLVNGRDRTIIVGLRGVGDAIDGKSYSRALQVSTTYYYDIVCSAGAYIASGVFRTDNIRLGNSAPDPPQYAPAQFGGWAWPTIDFTDLSKNYIDPQTGVLLKRLTGPGDEVQNLQNACFQGVVDLANAWNDIANLGCSADSAFATYSGPGGPSNALFLPYNTGIYRPSWTPNSWATADDMRLNLTGFVAQSGTTVSACPTSDAGQTCLGKPMILALPRSTSGAVSGPPNFPSALFHGWGDAPVRIDMMSNIFTGFIRSISGSTVTWGSNRVDGYNTTFPVTSLKSGDKIQIAGTNPTCPGNVCTIASIQDEHHLTLTRSVSGWTPTWDSIASAVSAGATSISVNNPSGYVRDYVLNSFAGAYILILGSDFPVCTSLVGSTFNGCSGIKSDHAVHSPIGTNAYNLPNFGIKLWANGPGTVSIDSANADIAASATFFVGFQAAEAPYCSARTVMVSVAADGVTPISPRPGYTCLFSSNWGNQHLYLLIPSTGESRLISDLYGMTAELNYSEPNTLFTYNQSTHVVQQCVYKGNWAAWKPYYNVNNPALQCTDITASGQDIQTEIAAAYRQIDFNYFGPPQLQSQNCASGVSARCLFGFQIRPGQNTIAWYCIVDISRPAGASQVVNCHNSFGTYPVRWTSAHGSEYIAGDLNGTWYASLTAQVEMMSPGSPGTEEWTLKINQVYNNTLAGTALTDTFVDPQTCEKLGVTDARWIAQGATGQNCIHINVASEPVATNPAPADLRPLGTLPLGARPGPWPHNAASCGGDGTSTNCWSELQPAEEGDYVADTKPAPGFNMFTGEYLLIAKKAVLANGTIDLILARGMNPFNCRGLSSAKLPLAHSGGWTAMMWPPQTCGVGAYFVPFYRGMANAIVDNPNVYIGHTMTYTNSSNVNFQWTPYSWNYPNDLGGYGAAYGVRSGPFPGILGKGFTYGIQNAYGFAGDFHGLNLGQIQSHPGGNTAAALPREQVWGTDGRPLGGAGGGAQDLWAQTVTPIPGTTSVYQLSLPRDYAGGPPISNSGWDTSLKRKLRQIDAFAGYHLLKDLSGPHSNISDSTPWSYCVVDVAPGECVAGSAVGNLYVAVPMAHTSGNCSSDGTIYAPCLATSPVDAGGYTQYEVDRPDPFGLRWRRLTDLLNGPGRADNFANLHALLTADWAVGAVKWGDGIRGDVFGIKLPPWPNEDSIIRNNFVKIMISLGGATGTSVRVRFGYSENLFCSSRLEQCSTAVANSDPYAWLSESQKWTPCGNETAGCSVDIPAVAGRVLYYVVDRQSSSGAIVSGLLTVTAVN
jgi:hypothetical protein